MDPEMQLLVNRIKKGEKVHELRTELEKSMSSSRARILVNLAKSFARQEMGPILETREQTRNGSETGIFRVLDDGDPVPLEPIEPLEPIPKESNLTSPPPDLLNKRIKPELQQEGLTPEVKDPTPSSRKGSSLRNVAYILGGVSVFAGLVGLAGVVYFTENASYQRESTPLAPQTVTSVPSPVIISPPPQPSVSIPRLRSEGEGRKIFVYRDNVLTITPVKGYGLMDYMAVIDGQDLSTLPMLDASEQEALLKESSRSLKRATKHDLEDLLLLMNRVEAQNKESIGSPDATFTGVKDPTKNIIQAGVPLTCNLMSTEVEQAQAETKVPRKIFTYNFGDTADSSDDTLTVSFTLPGAGISQYATVLMENGWNDSNLYILTLLDTEEQRERVARANTAHIKSLERSDEALRPILDVTRDVITDPANASHVYKRDTSLAGLKDGRRNIVYLEDTVQVEIPTGTVIIPLERIVEDNLSAVEPLTPQRIADEYFELRQIEREIPAVEDPQLMDQIVLNVARQYNATQTQDRSALSQDSYLSPETSLDDRLSLGRELYQKASDRREQATYMTVEEILDFINDGFSEDKVNAKDLRTNSIGSRQGMLQREIKDRRFDVWEKSLEYGLGRSKASFVRELAAEYGVSTSTIYNDLRVMNLDAPEPRNVKYV